MNTKEVDYSAIQDELRLHNITGSVKDFVVPVLLLNVQSGEKMLQVVCPESRAELAPESTDWSVEVFDLGPCEAIDDRQFPQRTAYEDIVEYILALVALHGFERRCKCPHLTMSESSCSWRCIRSRRGAQMRTTNI